MGNMNFRTLIKGKQVRSGKDEDAQRTLHEHFCGECAPQCAVHHCNVAFCYIGKVPGTRWAKEMDRRNPPPSSLAPPVPENWVNA